MSNPPNPFHSSHLDWEGPPPEVDLKVYEDHTRAILSKNTSPDIPFTWSLNPYRGCMHACAYCYARPTHEYLDFGAGTDFDRKIVVKRDAASLLRATFEKASWTGELVVFSGNTDCYQPIEATYELTRACLAVCLEYKNPVSIITKSALIERDVDLLAALATEAVCQVTISVPFFDPDNARKVEPFAPTPARRFKAMRRLADAGVPVAVNVAPIIPGLTDDDIPAILEAAAAAGARRAGHILVRLPGAVNEVFEERIRAAFPLRAEKILHRIEDLRGGKRNDARFGNRMSGKGSYWETVEALFQTQCRRLGLNAEGSMPATEGNTFRRPREVKQLSLF